MQVLWLATYAAITFSIISVSLTSRAFPFKKHPRCPKSDQKSFEDKTILHPTFAQHLAQQE